MNTKISSVDVEKPPLQIRILAWFGIVLGSMYLIYSIVNIILSFLDRTQGDITKNIIFLFYGLPIVAVSVAFLNKLKWGWVGFSLILAFIIIYTILSVFNIVGSFDFYEILVGILSFAAFLWIMTPSIRKEYFTS